jgi:hypothetical protein
MFIILPFLHQTKVLRDLNGTIASFAARFSNSVIIFDFFALNLKDELVDQLCKKLPIKGD